MQHAVFEVGADDLDVVGEAEAPLERASGDAAVQITPFSSSFFALPVTSREFSCTVRSISSGANPATAIDSR